MTTFSDMMQGTPFDMLVSMFGESGITYTPRGGTGVSVDGIFKEDDFVTEYENAEQDVLHATFSAKPSEMPTVARGDTITRNGVVWTVRAIPKHTPLLKLQLGTVETRYIGGQERVKRQGGTG